MTGMARVRALRQALPTVLVLAGCDLSNPADSTEYSPSRLPVGTLEIGAWLPAGMGSEVQLDEARLSALGITHLVWLQRAERDGVSAEALAMDLCSRSGLKMPVYYEPPGYSPYDKLRNWATRRDLGVSPEHLSTRALLGQPPHLDKACRLAQTPGPLLIHPFFDDHMIPHLALGQVDLDL